MPGLVFRDRDTVSKGTSMIPVLLVCNLFGKTVLAVLKMRNGQYSDIESVGR